MNAIGARFSWGSAARVAMPRWNSVVMMELVGSVIIIAFVSSILLYESQFVLAKVRMADTWNRMHIGRLAVLEHFAVTGRALETDMFGDVRLAPVGDAPEYEKHLSAAAAFAAVGGAAAAAGEGVRFGLSDTSAYYARSGVVDGAVVAIGRVRPFERPYRVSFSPAAGSGTTPVLLWSCGTAPPPPGFTRVGRRIPDTIEPQLMMFPCREAHPW